MVQIEPGPIPTLTASAPASTSAAAAVGRGDVAGDDLGGVGQPAHGRHAVEHALRVAVRGVDHDHVGAGGDQRLRPLDPGLARAGGCADAQPALAVLAGMREALRLLDVLDRDQADQAVGIVDHQQLLDPVLVQQLHGLGAADALLHRDQPLGGHQLAHRPLAARHEADVAVGEDAGQPAARPFDHRQAGDLVALHQVERLAQRRLGLDAERVHDHAGLELLDLLDLARLLRDGEILVQDADAAMLRHGDRHRRLGHRVHGGGDQGNAELDLAGQAGAHVDLRRQDLGIAGLQEHIVERQSLDHRWARVVRHRSPRGVSFAGASIAASSRRRHRHALRCSGVSHR